MFFRGNLNEQQYIDYIKIMELIFEIRDFECPVDINAQSVDIGVHSG
jgi:hypothetical protein